MQALTLYTTFCHVLARPLIILGYVPPPDTRLTAPFSMNVFEDYAAQAQPSQVVANDYVCMLQETGYHGLKAIAYDNYTLLKSKSTRGARTKCLRL